MTDQPITDFFNKMESFTPDDISVLFGLIAHHETCGPLLGKNLERRIWCVDIPKDRLLASIKRLVNCGELDIVFVPGNEESPDGSEWYSVKRFDELQESLANFGRRKYNRDRARKIRENSPQS